MNISCTNNSPTHLMLFLWHAEHSSGLSLVIEPKEETTWDSHPFEKLDCFCIIFHRIAVPLGHLSREWNLYILWCRYSKWKQITECHRTIDLFNLINTSLHWKIPTLRLCGVEFSGNLEHWREPTLQPHSHSSPLNRPIVFFDTRWSFIELYQVSLNLTSTRLSLFRLKTLKVFIKLV